MIRFKERGNAHDFPELKTSSEIANFLIGEAKRSNYLTSGKNWEQFEGIVPGARAAGIFIDSLKIARNMQAGYKASFTLPIAVWRDVTRQDKPRHELIPHVMSASYGGTAWDVLAALVGGQIYTAAVKEGVPFMAGDMKPSASPREFRFLSELLKSPGAIDTGDVYQDMPREYREFQQTLAEKGPLFKEDALKRVRDTLGSFGGTLRRDQHHEIGSRVLLEIFIDRLRQPPRQSIPEVGRPKALLIG